MEAPDLNKIQIERSICPLWKLKCSFCKKNIFRLLLVVLIECEKEIRFVRAATSF